MIVFMPSVGKKEPLLKLIKESMQQGDTLIANDLNTDAPALKHADKVVQLPRFEEESYSKRLEDMLTQEKVEVIIPTRTSELTFWREFGDKHPELLIVTHGKKTLESCASKSASYDFLKANGLPVAPYVVWQGQSVGELTEEIGELPYFAKPDNGSASIGAMRIDSLGELLRLPHGNVLQPMLRGDEYTLNTYTDRNGRCVCVIPHRRVEVTDGRVSTGYTYRNEFFEQLGQNLVAALGDTFGPLNFQLFHDASQGEPCMGNVWITDINPRFGGGYPLTHKAGGNFAHWILLEAKEKDLPDDAGLWKENVWIGKKPNYST